MNSDYHNRSGKDAPWQFVGTGLVCDFLCPRCNKNRPTLGMRLWRKTPRLMHCAKCNAKEKAKKRMAA